MSARNAAEPVEFRREQDLLALEAMADIADLLTSTQRSVARLAATQFRFLDTLRLEWERTWGGSVSTDPVAIASRSLRAEVAAALTIPERTAETMIGHARILVHSLPATLRGLSDGAFSERHARILADQLGDLTEALIPEFERQALRWAPTLTAAKFERKVRLLREQVQASACSERHAAAMAAREVAVTPAHDGMADLYAHLPAESAYAIIDYLTGIAKTLNTPQETRTPAQLRADVFCDLLLDEGALLPPGRGETALRRPAARPRGIRPTVHVTVPVLTLLGQVNPDAGPAVLDGYGPIDPATATRLAGAANGFRRILTHPETGVQLSFGRDRYAVPPGLRRSLRTRDATCRFIGCNRPAKHCDIDHTTSWDQHGHTDQVNLAHLCRGHHRLKHASDWQVHQAPDGSGTLTWTSPLGRRYTTMPDHAHGPTPAPGPAPGPGGETATPPTPEQHLAAQHAWLIDDPPPF